MFDIGRGNLEMSRVVYRAGGEEAEFSQCLYTAPVENALAVLALAAREEKKSAPPKVKTSRAVKAYRPEVRREAAPEKVQPEIAEPAEAVENTRTLELALYSVPETPVPAPAAEPEFQPVPEAGKGPLPFLSRFPSQLNEKVGMFIDFFQRKANPFFTRSLARSSAYEGMMKKILREKNLPEELFYLALIESGFNPKAFSPAKAGGIWQFISGTAKRFGLKVNPWVDERRDPEKSTYAAAEYLKNLFEIFNSWDLAAAGYNAGEGKVLNALKKTKSQEYWEIAQTRHLKRETKEYVPMFLAAVAIAQDPHKYGFTDIDYHPPLVYEKVLVPPKTSLASIARAARIEVSELQSLNPSLRTGMTPPDAPGFEIKLPPGKREVLEQNIEQLRPASISKSKKHRVRVGETLARVAKRHGVKIEDLCESNGLSPKSRLKPGSFLVLPR